MSTNTTEHSKFLNTADVANIFNVHQKTVRSWIESGALPAIRIARTIRIHEADLDKLTQRRAV